MKSLIGVDIGTQGTKAALFDEAGHCLAQAFCPSDLQRPAPGVVEEDPEKQVASVGQTIGQCLKSAGIRGQDVAGIGIDGQMAGVIGIGRDGKHITPYDSWLDQRCTPQIQEMERRAGDRVVAQSGCAPGFNHGPKKLWWMQERTKVYRQIAAFVQPGGYAAMRMCGLGAGQAFIDRTYLHFSGFADNPASQWDHELCETFSLDPAKLPRIVAPQSVVGHTTGSAARDAGLPEGVPVIAGCGDTAASFLACGAVQAGIGVDVAGTASVFAATTADFRPDQKYRMLGCGRSAVPGLWHPYAYINGGGMNLEWFRRELAADVSFEQLNVEAEAVGTADLPLFIPHLGGRACPAQPQLRGAWVGLSWAHGRGQLYRAVLESVALEYGLYGQVLQELLPESELGELRITGGGEKSAIWNRIKADVLQTTVVRIARSEGAPLGVALLAGFGVGLFDDLPATAKRWIELGESVKPRESLQPYYARRLRCYESVMKSLNGALITD